MSVRSRSWEVQDQESVDLVSSAGQSASKKALWMVGAFSQSGQQKTKTDQTLPEACFYN